ncbi:transporter substrate-binding domain-containing protein [Aneurinibacillus sp. UBA3580]|uniref:transporter substrate-binding domain-containing protein n=1 Tax=Aneurinibacillus sp. UBA3580 TaxID=1946041 RepID=UPI00257D2673|nr:transporter substrate-binding domain-containing protein [Aneurinibacillus sp. UBA3580]
MSLRKRLMLVYTLLVLSLGVPQLVCAAVSPSQLPVKKTYKIAAEWALPPFSYITSNGSFVGASIDIMDKIATYNNLAFEYIPMDLARAEKELQAGRIDAIAGMTYSTEKSGAFDFSDPYFTMSDALIIPKEKRQAVHSISDIRSLHVVLQNRKPVLESLLNLRHSNLTVTRNQLSGMLLLLEKRADVFIGNKWTANVYLRHFRQQDNFIILEEVIEPADFAIAVRKGDDSLLAVINRTLTTMKAKGEINQLMNNWLMSESDVQIARLQKFIQLLATVLIATACVLLFIYLWNQRLKKAVQSRTEELWLLTHHLQEQRQDIADRDAFKEQILNNIHTGIVTFSMDYKVTSYNTRANEMLGFTGGFFKEKNYPPLLARILAHYRDNSKQHQSHKNALTKLEINESGVWKVIYYRLLTLHDAQKKQIGYLLSMTDRTEETRLEQKLVMQEKLHALGQLVAGVAHEIRNPLTSIKTFVDLLPSKYDQPKFREAIMEHLPAEINRLNAIVTDLLDYARPRSPSKEMYPANALLTSLLTFLRVTLEKKEIVLEQSCQDDIAFYTDPQQIRQVFLNLLLNAIDAVEETAEKKIIITVEKENAETGRITIADTGTGIESEQMKRIFEPFYSSKHNGVGLGLPLSYKLLRENKGDIRITSHPGLGTKVTVFLPLHKPEEES